MRNRTGRRLWTLAIAGVAAVLWWAAPAQAHNQLIGSDPADEETLRQAPAQVELTFLATLDADGVEVTVTGPDGTSVGSGEPEVDGAELAVPLEATLAGEYEVAYEVLSTDGHVVDGSITFTVTEGEPPSPTPSRSPSPAAPSPTPAPAASPVAVVDEGSGGPAWWVWPVAGLAVAGAGYGGYRLVRRTR